MIDVTKERIALKAIQDLICHGKKLAFEGVSGEQMAKFFDDLEYLPALLLEQTDRTKEFENYLKEMCEDFDCNYVFTFYEKRQNGSLI